MATPPSYKAVLNHFAKAPDEVQHYFQHIPPLIENFDWDVCIAYQFIRVETAQNLILYCGVVKLHHTDALVTGSVLNSKHLTRALFLELFANIYGSALPVAIAAKLKHAEKVRDRIVHGKRFTEPDSRLAIVDVIDYATEMNNHLDKVAGFRPFGGDMRGFKGRAEPLDKRTTLWVLKGMGLA